MSIITATDVVKKYGSLRALDGFSCSIPKGITGILGPNGAGKTTFIKAFLGFHPFDEGQVFTLGEYHLPKDLMKIKDRIGYMPENDTRMIRTSAMTYVTHFGRLAGLPNNLAKTRAFDVLHYVGLEEARYRYMATFSSGMLQRVKLATALVLDPEILLLDEPTAGMDPPGREQMLKLISDLGQNHGIHIILSTHLLPDIERTSNYVVVISQGKTVVEGDLHTVLERKSDIISLHIELLHEGNNTFARILEQENYDPIINGIDITVNINRKEENDHYLKLFSLAKQNNLVIRKMTPYKQSLEDIFLDAVKED